jgi:hypothetical protein
MGLFSRSKPAEVHDPVFGTLKWSKDHWTGVVPSPIGKGTVLVSVARDVAGPRPEDGVTYQRFAANYSALTPKLSAALFVLWEPGLSEPLWEESWPSTEKELWRMLELSSLEVQQDGTLELLYAFRDDVWPDAMFTLAVQGAQVHPLSLDD